MSLLLSGLIWLGLSAQAVEWDGLPQTSVDLRGKVHEECTRAGKGDGIRWEFLSSAPVDFNLHHHIGSKVLMPVNKKGISSDEGRLTLDSDAEWCLMWKPSSKKNSRIRLRWILESKSTP